jgi:GlcNAc-P-P-Und epimerase
MHAVIFGGSGFIGRHLACHLLDNRIVDSIVIADLHPIDEAVCTLRMRELLISRAVRFEQVDVRGAISLSSKESVDLVINLAAIHREPGHQPNEYYETNLLGAENVCGWAVSQACNTIIFTSSISPYGPAEEVKNENSIPVPVTAYGCSKLVAEKIHGTWQAQDQKSRRLIILRPGVVFGAGERGNVSRLVKAVLNGYFVFMGNRATRKAGIYVKELCCALTWVLNDKSAPGAVLFNMSMDPGPTIGDYVRTVQEIAGVNSRVFGVPFIFVYIASHIVDPILRLLRVSDSFHPTRVLKLIRSNNIEPLWLREQGYKYHYTLSEAFVDWKFDMPSEW